MEAEWWQGHSIMNYYYETVKEESSIDYLQLLDDVHVTHIVSNTTSILHRNPTNRNDCYPHSFNPAGSGQVRLKPRPKNTTRYAA